MPIRWLLVLPLVACDPQYHTAIEDPPAPDAAAAPERWTVRRAAPPEALRAIACLAGGRGAIAVGDGGTVLEIAPDGALSPTGRLPRAAFAVEDRGGSIVAGGSGLWRRDARGDWSAVPLPRGDAVIRSIASGADGTLWVAGRAGTGDAVHGWAAAQRDGRWVDRFFPEEPELLQVRADGRGAVLIAGTTPYVWDGAAGGLRRLMPYQPDAHPPILAMTRLGSKDIAVGLGAAWRREGTVLVREHRQGALRLESVATGSGLVAAVGRDDTQGATTGGVVLERDARGRWARALLVPDSPLHAIAICGGTAIAVGDAGVVAIRR